MKRCLAVGLIVCAAWPIWAMEASEEPEVIVVEEIIAKVNGEIITRTDLKHARQSLIDEMVMYQLSDAKIEEELKIREPNLLRDKIDELLLISRGEMLGIDVEDQVRKRLADLMLQSNVADQDKFADLIREQTGMRYEDYRQQVEDSIITQEVLGVEVSGKIVISNDEIQQYYDEHKEDFMRDERVFLQEILISTADKEGDELAAAEELASDIVERARRGEKFEELAEEYSDADSASEGGDLGGWKKGELLANIEETVWDKERNYVTDPIKIENGWLILKVTAHHQAGLALLDEVEGEIGNILFEPKFNPMVREYLAELRKEAFLEIKEGYVDTGAVAGKNTSWSDPAQLTPDTISREEIFSNPGRKRALWLFPVPGTQRSGSSSSR